MKYIVSSEELKSSLNPKLKDFVKKYPKSREFRLELEYWRPEDFLIKRYQTVETTNQKLIEIPINTDKIPVFELNQEKRQKLQDLDIKFKLSKDAERLICKILPTNVVMDRLTPLEWDDLVEEMMQQKQKIKQKAENQRVMEDDIEERQNEVDEQKRVAYENDQKFKEPVNRKMQEILDKEEGLNSLIASVENMKIRQDAEYLENLELNQKLQLDVVNLQEKVDDVEFLSVLSIFNTDALTNHKSNLLFGHLIFPTSLIFTAALKVLP